MSVRSTALRLSIACRRAMPEAVITIYHSRASWGQSSYVRIRFGRNNSPSGWAYFTQARVSDHGIGVRRKEIDITTTLYLADGARRGAWELWLAGVAAEYRRLGGALPALEGLFGK